MKDNKGVFHALTLISQLGISIVVPVLLCTFLGDWLERRFSFPVFIPLLILGVLAGLRNAYELIKPLIARTGDEEEQRARHETEGSDGETG